MRIIIVIAFLISSIISCGIKRPNEVNKEIKSTVYNGWSENMLKNLKANKEVTDIQTKLANVTKDELNTILVLDEQRKAFWINIYNGYIIALLRKDKSLFDDRGAFFTKKQIKIAGETLSFDDIENGMIRKSQFKFGLGYVGKVFPPAFERQLRVKQRDFRIHFAINCGAKSCPPVRIYAAKTVNEQLQNATKMYLTDFTKYNKENNTVETSTLMSWFRGDFGGKYGTKKILKEFNLIPDDSNPNLTFGNYDWTLDINNFAE
ncbi:DUF547 domain-containing protein [Pedobacter cryophilus]|uniref:DUF547 domain-containing protein n=1 Tax=Pedobacter cryophilus TaxID=2571271 RepID=A0A4U1C3E8_9SPHI|nr:DUF547 domain-containing protein [Pedobacter cryophilus]TKB97724.1 DUF547 domain-containing protein [Pedobacter cryophilus]